MKNKRLKKLLAGAMVASMCIATALPVSATNGGAETAPKGTDIVAGVIMEDETTADVRIRVTVPTLFAFVANGKKNDNTAMTDDGNVILPNVQVKEVPGGKYEVVAVGDGVMSFTNYSTKLKGAAREGIAVNLTGSIKNVGTDKSRGGWKHVNSVTSNTADKKKYVISVDDTKFDKEIDTETFAMGTAKTLDAPDVASGGVDANTGLAKIGKNKNLPFKVDLGGTRGDYTKLESSAKVGAIEWTVAYEVGPVPTP